ncbi:receptor-type tyrosine-protein phosphatase eta-like isoform X2 [Ylistrum balloti]|uniref:receptor-type tyrosine-protein phosphatase eta-like isoform X2 n=1 Tax=Ylistrum balloti TaxID=509963 RepID=UPI002905C4FB|nr:receptor-type tyrosine-protein phosphatase eta-like isoform X2 [Ylistrum balloti]
MTPEMKAIVLVCFVLKICNVSCQNGTATANPLQVNHVQCNYTTPITPGNQTAADSECLCPVSFIAIKNLTCAEETDLRPMNIKFEVNEKTINVTWTYKSFPPWKFSSELTTNIYGNLSMFVINRTEFTLHSSQPGQKVNLSISPVLSGGLIAISAVEVSTIFKPAKPGLLINPVGGYDAPNTTIQWIKSVGLVDKYLIYMTLLCPVGVPEKFRSKTASISVFGLEHEREYRLNITAMRGDVSSDTRTTEFATNYIVPDPPGNVTILQPIGNTTVFLTIAHESDVKCSKLIYPYKLRFKRYLDQKFTLRSEGYFFTNQTNQRVDNLTPGAEYLLEIFSENKEFTSTESLNLTFRTAESVPGKVQNVTITDVNPTSFSVRFDRPEHPNGMLTAYVLTLSSSPCKVRIMSLSAGFNCSSLQERQNGTKMDCECIEVVYTPFLQLEFNYLLSYTTYILTVEAHNSAGAGVAVTGNVTTAIGAPHTPGDVEIRSVKSHEATVYWTYGYRTGPTDFRLEITDEVFQLPKKTQKCPYVTLNDPSCTAVDLKAYWKYSVLVIANTTTTNFNSSKSKTFITSFAIPGKVRGLGEEKEAGDDCTEDIYGVKWTEPEMKNRNGIIAKYKIVSSLGRHRNMYERDDSAEDRIYKNTSKTFVALFEKAGNKAKKFNVTVVAVIDRKHKSEPTIVQIHIPPCSPGLSSNEVAGVIVLVLICVIAIIILLVMLYRWKMFPFNNSGSAQLTRASTGPGVHISRHRPFVLGRIKQLVDRMKKDSGRLCHLEWDDLNSLSPHHPTEVALLAANARKNRYNNILPFDRSRVKLCSGGDDYINANYIPGYKFEREYIACQGPLPNTTVDFWQMVWEQDVPIIVMLTRCNEGDVIKCEQYWPEDLHDSVTYGKVEVTRTVSEGNNEYVYSEFNLTSADHEKSVKHFHFLEWPDFGAELDFNVFLEFLFRVKSEIHDDLGGPIIVHCSAGVGRTGTYLVLDYLTEFLKTHNLSQEFDIFQCVLNIRQHRTKMVQAREQYLFIHECLQELVRRQMTLENLNGDGLQMPSEQEYSDQLFDPENKLMIEEGDCKDGDNGNVVAYDNPSMTTEL